MSLDAILEAIRQSGEASARAIEDRAREDVARIMAEAEREAKTIELEARRAAASMVTADQARIIHRARLEAMQIVGHAEQQVVEGALERVRLRCAELRAAPDYRDLMRHLLGEALAALQGSLREGERAHLYADPRDRALLEDLLRDIRLDASVRYELESWGGVRATSADQRVVVDNTLESRLAFATPFLRRCLPTLLTSEPEDSPALRQAEGQSSTS